MTTTGPERLQKFLAQAGLGSRRQCEALIREGRVSVDGKVAAIGSSVDPEEQRVEFDGRLVTKATKEYWLLNKPRGMISTAFDPQGRPTVVDCVPARGRVFPVGRLDSDSTGLLILTNDGELTARLLHPRYHVEKEYDVTVADRLSPAALRQLREGVRLEEGWTSPARVEVLSTGKSASGSALTIMRMVITEGRKRQIRRMLQAVGYQVIALHRRRFDGLTDAGLAIGQARRLSEDEVGRLKRSAGES